MNLRETQQRFAAALMTPLTGDDRIGRRTRGRTRLKNEAAEMVRPNDRLTSFERLEIYRRSYWFRLLDSIRDDYPGLKAILTGDRFGKLATAYLADCPSESFTLRDLGSRLAAWLEANPRYAGANRDLALDMARLEWAHVVAFDGKEQKTLGPEDLIEPAPNLRLGLQPYITLLELRYPVDVIRVGLRRSLEVGTSDASAVVEQQPAAGKFRPPAPERLFLAVHRVDTCVCYRRLAPEEYRLLAALRDGRTLAASIRTAFLKRRTPPGEMRALLQNWFAVWAELGWLTVRQKSKQGRL